jgi:magnesium-transporting ATPase (P-type)
MIIAFVTLVVLITRYSITNLVYGKSNLTDTETLKHLLNYLFIGFALFLVAIPLEGVLVTLYASMAFTVKKMMTDNNLIRHLDACEAIGNVTTICTDMTGTLTTNRMTCVQCYMNDRIYETLPAPGDIDGELVDLINTSIAVNSNYASKIEPGWMEGQLPTQLGNKTECGLLGFVEQLGGDYEKIRAAYPTRDYVHCYTFNSARKSMSTVVRHPTIPGALRLFCKGASEMVLVKCKFIKTGDKVREFSSADYNSCVRNVIEPFASNGLRTIGVAYKDFIPAGQAKGIVKQSA